MSSPSSNPWLVLGLLLIANVLNYLDRQIPFILAVQIRTEFGLSDAQLGILGGASFAIAYGIMSVPLARLADRRSAIGVFTASMFIWSVMTAAGAWAQNFVHLVLARVGVAFGEAGALPASHSIIARSFAPHQRATAIAIVSLGIPLGIMLGMTLGGYLGEWAGWRVAMMIVGVPGILLAAVAWLLFRREERKVDSAETSSLVGSYKLLLSIPAYARIVIGVTCCAAAQYSFVTFLPSILDRSFGMRLSSIGLWLGLAQGVVGGLGTIAGGILSDRYGHARASARLIVAGAVMLASIPFFIAAFATSSLVVFGVLLIVPIAAFGVYVPAVYSAIQDCSPSATRATAAAGALLVTNVFGGALGPLVTGTLSDAMQPILGHDSLRYAMIASAALLLVGGLQFLQGARKLEQKRLRDLDTHSLASVENANNASNGMTLALYTLGRDDHL